MIIKKTKMKNNIKNLKNKFREIVNFTDVLSYSLSIYIKLKRFVGRRKTPLPADSTKVTQGLTQGLMCVKDVSREISVPKVKVGITINKRHPPKGYPHSTHRCKDRR